MAHSHYRGFDLQTLPNDPNMWQVKIKNHVLRGNLAAVKKSIDWFCDTASIVDPQKFASLERNMTSKGSSHSENHHGFWIKNDSGEPNGWYCFFNGKLLKGSKTAIQRHIDAHLMARKRAQMQ
ncbi:DUF3319 domain-containing protein [Vibrio sp. SM6]|uniref:DUF3319 domain-containing protein n=1 Tax=Vibrio agarilyticus TaxID=2726741 RepID=A0A7X8TRN7_9VIBR|nr:DUF3319 domain-containing protein [Vibrio agarilyticus]NLS13381.1 DUF3319 domain-containing protein [Vibrio agarilyticus]